MKVRCVSGIRLDNERQVAIVQLKIKKLVVLTDDVIASVKTSGLIGDKFIKLTPGGSDLILTFGDSNLEAESVLGTEELFSRYVSGSAEN